MWALATFVAFFIKGLCGFANTLVFTTILGFGEANVNISPVELLLGFPSNLILVFCCLSFYGYKVNNKSANFQKKIRFFCFRFKVVYLSDEIYATRCATKRRLVALIIHGN